MGPKTELAPDILFTVDGFAYAVDTRYITEDDMVTTGRRSAARNGSHRMNRIYWIAGAGIEPEIAPTILYT